METVLNELYASYPGRKAQIEQLYNLFRHRDEQFVDFLYVHGGPSVGKTCVVKSVLNALHVRHAVLNLIESYTTKILLETILNKLTNHSLTSEKPHSFAKCDNMMEFINNLNLLVDKYALKNCAIILDKAERLRNMESNLLPCFTKLRELSGLNISVIFISEIAFQKYYGKGNITEPIKIAFNQYNKDEILEILLLDFNYAKECLLNNYNVSEFDIDLEFYKQYLNVFLSVFYRACRDLSELRYMSKINFIKYCEPIFESKCVATNHMVLWRNIAPILKSSLEVLYLRLSTTNETKKPTFSKENLAQSLELPFYAKYLLIAAYLGSYNSAKDDKRIFVKYHGKKLKTMKDVKVKSKVSEQLNTQLGPKPFSLDRLLAIFYAILDDKVGFNNNLLVQVSSLVELQLLTSLSDNCNLDGQKYKCTVNFEFIQTISKMVGFNIRKYLSDFSHM